MIEFEKLHGTGNDFIIINGIDREYNDLSQLAKDMCNRHFGMGSDGLMVVENSLMADIKMKYFNHDGSIAPMCGNGIRCFVKYVFDNKIILDKKFTVETLAGILEVEILNENDIRVNLGEPIFCTRKFPINTDKKVFINEDIIIDNETYTLSTINMGTIHTVLFVDDLESIDIEKVGETIQNLPLFPQKTNVNFCEMIDPNHIKVITYERGVGKTLSCGTGCCASVVIGRKLFGTSKKVNVEVLGGNLQVELIHDDVFLSGPARRICKGAYEDETL